MKKFITTLATLFVINSVSAHAESVESWSCSAQTGLMDSMKTEVRLEKQGDGYDLFVTANTNGDGTDVLFDDEKLAEGLDCQFSYSRSEPVTCKSGSIGSWITLDVNYGSFISIDESNGMERYFSKTPVILSGSLDAFQKFDRGALKFNAENCTRN